MRIITIILIFVATKTFSQTNQNPEAWELLIDKDLSKWENYLSYKFSTDYNGKIPLDEQGNEIPPIGYNKDDKNVFSVTQAKEGPILRISGEIYGCLFTKTTYENYHLKLKVKWGDFKFEPRKDKLKDSGVLYHSIGEAGVEYWRSWMLSQEFQIMEGHMGDFWCQANSAIDIRAYPSEANGIMSSVADTNQPFRSFKSGSDYFCMRSGNYESPAGEWTNIELISYNGNSLHIVNGNVVMVLKNSRYIDENGKEFPLTKGKIQLQSEAAEVFYKDIRIKQLEELPMDYKKFFE